jgi:hypothetical protein
MTLNVGSHLAEEAGKLLPHLAILSDEHEGEGKQLQGDISVFESEFKAVVEDYWKEEHGDQAPISTERVQETKSRPEKPIFGGDDWKVGLFL